MYERSLKRLTSALDNIAFCLHVSEIEENFKILIKNCKTTQKGESRTQLKAFEEKFGQKLQILKIDKKNSQELEPIEEMSALEKSMEEIAVA